MTSSPSKAPNVNTFFCGTTWDCHIKNCPSSTPCPIGDECPPGEQCFAASPCAYLSSQDDSSFAPTPQAEIVAVASITRPTSSPSNSPIMSLPSKAPTVNTFFCGITWDYHTSNCASSTPCPRGDECPLGEKCFSNSPCATFNSHEDVNVDSTTASFCSTEYNLLLTTVSDVLMGPLSSFSLLFIVFGYCSCGRVIWLQIYGRNASIIYCTMVLDLAVDLLYVALAAGSCLPVLSLNGGSMACLLAMLTRLCPNRCIRISYLSHKFPITIGTGFDPRRSCVAAPVPFSHRPQLLHWNLTFTGSTHSSR